MYKNEELNVRIAELRGNYYQIGLEQGNELKSLPILKQLEQLKELTKNSNVQSAKQIIRSASPNFFQELKGLAAGLGMDLDSAIQLFSGYDVVFPEMGCTTLINNGYYVRNYDFSPEMYDARLVFMNPVDGYSSVGFSQQVIGRLDGMNEKGLVVGLHFVNNNHREEGFIATTIVRMLLEQCTNIEEAITFITNIPHGYCYNYSITDQSGKSVLVEAAPQHQVINSVSPLICTNHFESETLRGKNRMQIQGSVKRKEYVNSLLKENLTAMSAYYHFNEESSPLFFKYYKEYFGTLHTVVYSPEDLSIIIGVGGNSKPMVFSLIEYIEGRASLPKFIKGIIKHS
ncbi:peptidase C45 [Alkalihalobacillus alcalophilus ATCC 27647 = CGMCC 1.3604]|uniref:Acyl-CoA:6-aminopenicillanic acid acyltransferase n=1 Tax=Alkalihalobacillus alcalophilus ATCC 27647 = CGMCC 1.3604 TaxID=1218173 RepID=A0A094YVH0_ALKAL|nr:C45 family peptidase [Alkalihalobacillus alcalophilus]KGA97512.1 acyl-CoA:6-aminopenicillanic acid acyltransferase [Alkalihalobacillus alcalophilus ATCC 27647 = CGMCC 1.3604]MED1560762.1 C45 family autoproteolytic acyltransferase/hydrolase [Alkalihalobacillus alcalophilus]THG91919.1 peptidase C45 [Alkalihalobacillus alcalophilus ATCC 27647 = CGMCC 1.3604]